MLEIPVIQYPNAPVWQPPQVKSIRRKTRKVWVGDIPIGGDAPVSVQTMTKTKTSDVDGTVEQIRKSADEGCDIVRITVNDKQAAAAMAEIVRKSPLPIVADIHFNHIFALEAIKAGVAKVRINPGNIGSIDRIHQVLAAAKERGIPIRIGVNSGSLEEDILEKHGYPTPEALFESAMRHANICEEFGFHDVIISVKSTDTRLMIEAYRYIAERTDYPLHLGVTEAGARSSRPSESARCSPKESATQFAFPSPTNHGRKSRWARRSSALSDSHRAALKSSPARPADDWKWISSKSPTNSRGVLPASKSR
jgi:(E)-4-hydroxy-3-methylbut-2-enyl-diphosphate synthase